MQFKQDYSQVNLWINEFDPLGLIAIGAPNDEYDSLTNQILSFLYADKPRNDIKELILRELEQHFEWAEVRNLKEPYQTIFTNDLEKFLDKLEK